MAERGHHKKISRREALVGGGAATVFVAGVAAAVSKQSTAGPTGGPDVAPELADLPPVGSFSPAQTPSTVAPAGKRAAGVTTSKAGADSPPPGLKRRPLTAAEKRLHVINRLTFGPTPELVDQARRLGPRGFIAWQLAPDKIDDSVCDNALAPLRTLHQSADQIASAEERSVMGQPVGHALSEARLATVVRAAVSKRQLFEVMVHFWTDHFNIYPAKDSRLSIDKPIDDRVVIRRHALGTFAELLSASAHSPAMLRYLDNADSNAEKPNENYARELLELHTLGVGNYREADVKAAARVFSGWTVDGHAFRFDPARHASGPARVLGWSTPGRSGPDALHDGENLLWYLSHHRSTARHLGFKLAERFVADDPPPRLVEHLADVYLASKTAVGPVLEALFASDEFWESATAKLRRPFDFAAFALRAAGAWIDTKDADAASNVQWQLARLGQGVWDWPPPNGYPDVAAAWSSPNDVLARWNFAMALAQNWFSGVTVEHGDIAGAADPARRTGDMVDQILKRVLVLPAPRHVRDALLQIADRSSGQPLGQTDRRGELIGAALCAAEAQYR